MYIRLLAIVANKYMLCRASIKGGRPPHALSGDLNLLDSVLVMLLII